MKYVSIDIETTGLNSDTCQILEFAAVIDETQSLESAPTDSLPHCHFYVTHGGIGVGEYYGGEPFALSMNADILKRISNRDEGYLYVPIGCVAGVFRDFLEENGYSSEEDEPIVFTAAGKNFASFDNNFLTKVPSWGRKVKAHHRTIDPGMLFWKPGTDEKLPDSKTCMQRAGIEGEVAHTALEDARMVVELVRAGVCEL